MILITKIFLEIEICSFWKLEVVDAQKAIFGFIDLWICLVDCVLFDQKFLEEEHKGEVSIGFVVLGLHLVAVFATSAGS